MELTEKAAGYAHERRLRLLQDMRRVAVEGLKVAGNRQEHLRWTAVIGLARDLEEELEPAGAVD